VAPGAGGTDTLLAEVDVASTAAGDTLEAEAFVVAG